MKKFIPWFVAYVILAVIFGTIYTVAQQILRQAANDPQIQLAEDAASQLNDGVKPSQVVAGKVDMSTSLAPFIIIYNKQGTVVGGSGYLNGSIPTVPYGVLQHATPGHDHLVSWQPQANVRIASVTAAASNYYVLSGRNLREVEKRETAAMQLSGIGWLLSLAVLAAFYKLQSQTGAIKK